MNLDLYDNIGTDSIDVYVRNDNATYFDSIIAGISRFQAFDSVIREYFYNGFINFILDKKSLTDFTVKV